MPKPLQMPAGNFPIVGIGISAGGLAAFEAFFSGVPSDAEALFRELLIGFTGFFRDPEAFQALEKQVISKLFARKEDLPELPHPVRINSMPPEITAESMNPQAAGKNARAVKPSLRERVEQALLHNPAITLRKALGTRGSVRWTEAEALTMNARDRIPKNHIAQEMKVIHQLAESEILDPYLTQRIAKDGTLPDVWLTSTTLVCEAGLMYAIATTERVKK